MLSPLALAALFATETRESALETLLDIAKDVGLKITSWQPGQPIRTTLTTIAQKLADVSVMRVVATKGGFLDEATGDWLTLLAWSVYRVARLEARFASGDSFRFVNTSPVELVLEPGDLIVAHKVTGKTYRNEVQIVIPPRVGLVDGVLEGAILVADEAGTGSDAAPGMIDELVSSLAGVTVTNEAAVLGADAELDEEVRSRCRAKLGALSPNGPKEIYEYVAKTPDLAATSVPITRVDVVPDAATGELDVWIATAAGAPSAADVAVVDAALDVWATPWCVTARARAAVEREIPITCHVWIAGTSYTAAQIENEIATALAVYMRGVPLSGFVIPPDVGKVYVGGLERAIGTAVAGTYKVEVTAPAADVELAEGEVATLGALTVEVTIL